VGADVSDLCGDQLGGGDATALAHVTGHRALTTRCEARSVERKNGRFIVLMP
jgi:hypothetical protein